MALAELKQRQSAGSTTRWNTSGRNQFEPKASFKLYGTGMRSAVIPTNRVIMFGNIQEKKAAAQAKRPIVSNRPPVPRWLPFLVDCIAMFALTGTIVSSVIVLVETSAGALIPAMGGTILLFAFLTATVTGVRIRSRIRQLK